MGMIVRKEGWELRLNATIDLAREEPYVLGKHDCFRVALRAVEALSGVDLWPRFEGRYSNRREAVMLLADFSTWPDLTGRPVERDEVRALLKRCGSIFDAAFSFLFDVLPCDSALARRGDICKFVDQEPHLGVCVGDRVAVLNQDGLAFATLRECEVVWRIG